jgi:DeoR/GlpR family transcriptional regulator of sugar metabolism
VALEMDRYSRWSALLELLAREERLTVDDAAHRLGVSAATVRRDFETLAKQRKIVRLRGAALHSAAPAAGNHFGGSALATPSPHARRVASQVAAQLRAGTVVGLAGAPMIGQIARAIGVRFEASAQRGASAGAAGAAGAGAAGAGADGVQHAPALTVVTNDLTVAAELVRRPGLKVVTTGGVLAPLSLTLTGPLAGLLLQGVSLDVAVIAADAADPAFGVTGADEVEAEGCSLMIARARRVVVAALSADLDRSAFARICGTERVDVLVTDAGIAPATAERFANRGVRVVTA